MKEPVLMQRLSEKSIARVLYYIRAEAIRDGLDGLDHVDALLTLRGHDPEAYHVPQKAPKRFKRGQLKRMLMELLREGPDTARGLAERVAAQVEGVEASDILASVRVQLSVMGRQGAAGLK